MTRIGLLRHFPTLWNRQGRLQGRADIPLSADSLMELEDLTLPPPWDQGPLLSSPLARARATAVALAGGREVATDPRLVEMDFGAWEGRIGADLLADPASGYRPLEDWGQDFTPPGGESPARLAERLRPALADIARGGPCLIVTHRGVLRAILAMATGWTYSGPMPFRLKNRAVHPVTLSPGGAPVAVEPPVRLCLR